MRYPLKVDDTDHEIELTLVSTEGFQVITATTLQDDHSEKREFILSHRCAHELSQDGSLKRQQWVPDLMGAREWEFLHQSQTHQVALVGGLVGSREGGAQQGRVTAPMNGMVVKVLKKMGERVHAGDVVLILEAMKMENEVEAPRTGVMGALEVSAGQTVLPGQPLFFVDSEE